MEKNKWMRKYDFACLTGNKASTRVLRESFGVESHYAADAQFYIYTVIHGFILYGLYATALCKDLSDMVDTDV